MTAPSAGKDRPLRDTVRHTLIYGLGNMSVAFLSLILVPVYTFHLTPADFGLLALWLAVYGLLGRLYDFGMQNSVGRFYFDAKDGKESLEIGQMSVTTLAYLLVHAGVLSLLLWVCSGRVSSLLTGGPDHAGLVKIISVTLLADALAIVPLTLIRMEERSARFVVLSTFRFATALVLNILFVVGLGWGVRGILLSGAITSCALLMVLAPEQIRRMKGGPSLSLLRRMLEFGLPLLPVPLCIWLIDSSDRYLLELFRTREEVGYYALGYKIAQVVQLLVIAFSMGWAPLRYKIFPREDAKEVYRKLATLYVAVVCLVGVGVILVGTEVVGVVAPDSYASASKVVPPLVLAYALYGLFVVLLTGMGVTKKTKPMAWIALVGGGANLGLNLLLIPEMGMIAAAWTTVAANAILAGGAWFYSQKVYEIPYDWMAMAKALALGTLVALADGAVAPPTLLGGLTVAILLLLGFLVLLIGSGSVARSDLTALRRWVLDLRSVGRG